MTKIFVAGHKGMAGSAICRKLVKDPEVQLIIRSRFELDLSDQQAVQSFMQTERPDEVILAAAKVGGIHANNTYPAEFIYQNLQIQNNVIHFSHVYDVQKLLFLGSSCIYPKCAEQPMKEAALLSGKLEPTNEPYAIAKIAGIKMCESYRRQYGRDYRTVMPANLFGPGDNYHPENSHVVAALLRRFHEAKLERAKDVLVWGSGAPKREFMYVDDMADASIFLHSLDLEKYNEATINGGSHVNIGTGNELSIRELAEAIKKVVGFKGSILFDTSKPDGAPRKLMSTQLLNNLGWTNGRTFLEGLSLTYEHYLSEKYNYGN